MFDTQKYRSYCDLFDHNVIELSEFNGMQFFFFFEEQNICIMNMRFCCLEFFNLEKYACEEQPLS